MQPRQPFPNRLDEARAAIRRIREDRARKQVEPLRELLLKHAIKTELKKC
jgi:hypothetical protein